MNTREREVMDALYRFASHATGCAIRKPDPRSSTGVTAMPCDCGLVEARVAYSALAEGSASSEGAEAVAWREIQPDGRPVDEHGRYYPVPAPAGWVIESISKRGGRVEYVYSHPQPAQGEHERRSCEGSERRPIADEVVERACAADGRMWALIAAAEKAGAIKDDDDEGSFWTLRCSDFAALESAHPRGLPVVPNGDDGHELAHRLGVLVYGIDFGDEGMGYYVRLRDFKQVCERGLPAGSDTLVTDAMRGPPAWSGILHMLMRRGWLAALSNACHQLKNGEHAQTALKLGELHSFLVATDFPTIDAKAPFALPVEVDSMEAHENYKAYSLKDANGRSICDTLNSDLIEVHDEIDDDGAYSWDEVGRRNMEYIAATLNRVASGEPTAEHWKQAISKWNGDTTNDNPYLDRIEKIARELCSEEHKRARSAAAKGEG